MTGTKLVSMSVSICALILALHATLAAQWSESFDSYATGGLIGKGGWTGWGESTTSDASVTKAFAASAPNAVEMLGTTDTVHPLSATSGRWTFRAKVYVPSGHTGTNWLILLNKYDGALDNNWSSQVTFTGSTVVSHGGTNFFSDSGSSMPAVLDAWKEVRIDIDLDANRQTVYYDGKRLHSTAWQYDGVDEVRAVDLWSDTGTNPSSIYVDDLVFERWTWLDCNMNGRPDNEDIADGTSTDCNSDFIPDECRASAGFDFADPVHTNAGYEPKCVVPADLDRDGDEDLAVTELDQVMVLLNDGHGAFSVLEGYPVGGVPGNLQAADLDGDGDPDIATANRESESVAILLGTGSGALAPALNVETPKTARDLSLADVNGDGDIDLTVIYGGEGIWVFENDGTATFTQTLTLATGQSLHGIITGDLDGDGNVDLVTRNRQTSASISVHRGTGGGNFVTTSHYDVFELVLNLAILDIEGDGRPSVAGVTGGALGSSSSSSVFVLRNHGDGTLEAMENYPVGSVVEAIASGDLNGDGRVDLAVAGASSEVWILPNGLEARFLAPVHLTAHDGPTSVAIADLDGDLRMDLAVVSIRSNDVSVLLHGPASAPRDPCGPAFGQKPGDATQDGMLDLTDAIWVLSHLFAPSAKTMRFPCEGGTASDPGPGDLALVDSNGDGAIDLSDPVMILSHLFAGNRPPVLGTECVPIAGCPDACH